jgi:NADH-quinone oxidoreductase subunit J
MNASAIIFYIISAFILGTAVLAVTSKKIFRSAIWLLLTLVGIAGLYFWLQVEFIAAVQIAVYVGGIVVLIIFSIFLTQQSGKDMPKPRLKQSLFSILAGLFGFLFTFNLVNHYEFIASPPGTLNSSISEIGTQLLSTKEHGYILPFEVVSMLLLSAIIGCIVIAIKPAEQKAIEKGTIIISGNNDAGPKEVTILPETLITEEV